MSRRHFTHFVQAALVGSLALGVTVLAAGPSSAAVARTTSHGHHRAKKHSDHNSKSKKKSSTSTGTPGGADASGSFCQLYKKELDEGSAAGNQLEKDIEANDWTGAQKVLETDFASSGKAASAMLGSLSSAPANVQAAARYAVSTIYPQEVAAVKDSTSLTQYESATNAIFQNATTVSNTNVLKQYENTECGTVTATT